MISVKERTTTREIQIRHLIKTAHAILKSIMQPQRPFCSFLWNRKEKKKLYHIFAFISPPLFVIQAWIVKFLKAKFYIENSTNGKTEIKFLFKNHYLREWHYNGNCTWLSLVKYKIRINATYFEHLRLEHRQRFSRTQTEVQQNTDSPFLQQNTGTFHTIT
jgi:hypothetical protein